MPFLSFKLDVHHSTVQARAISTDGDEARVPDNLSDLTYTIIQLHKANGDLHWLKCAVEDAEDANHSHPTWPAQAQDADDRDEAARALNLMDELQSATGPDDEEFTQAEKEFILTLLSKYDCLP